MTGKIQKMSIRLLKEGVQPADSLRKGAGLRDWEKVKGGQIAFGTSGGGAPKWADFLELSDQDKKTLLNNNAYGVVFITTDERWFAVTFGAGHAKLDPAKCEQDFGLRVVLNAVDPRRLKSVDVRTPDENTLSRRSQTSRGSDQTAFAFDVERDIVRGLAGTPKEASFASRVAGSDALTMDRRMTLADLPKACSEAYRMYQKTDYRTHFPWIDQIKHIRDRSVIDELNGKVVDALNKAIREGKPDSLHFARPVIYDPERLREIRYKGLRSKKIYPDLELEGYLDALEECGKDTLTKEDLEKHSAHEVDDDGNDCGEKWKIADCLVYETELDGQTYVLSGGRWYQVDKDLAAELRTFFKKMSRCVLPEAHLNENEEKYNTRIKGEEQTLLCLDRRLIKPTGSRTTIEVCDFLGNDGKIIHIKDMTSSSRLSHLFSQGTVSGRILKVDSGAREEVRKLIRDVQRETGRSGFDEIICGDDAELEPQKLTVVYGVIGSGGDAKMPFFSMVTLRQAARDLQALGYKVAFAWIKKPPAVGRKATRTKSSKRDADTEGTEHEAAE